MLNRIFRRFLTSGRPKMAIVGSGPAGMFTCSGILRKSAFEVDVFEYSPVPFGLVRYGVAPDHQEVKNCINLFDTMFEKNRGRLRLFCNVNIGKDVTFNELSDNYDAVLLAYGSYKTRKLGIPGSETAKNVISGSEFVGWYNGVPNAPQPDMNIENVVIVGNGNVALDCARILSTAGSGNLRSSDIPDDRLDLLEKAPLKNIKVLGRRGPENVSFTIKELREQFKIQEWDSKMELSEIDERNMKEDLKGMERKQRRLSEVILKNAGIAEGDKTCQFWFHRIPQEIVTREDGRIEDLRVLNREDKENEIIEELPCDLLIYSIGYETMVLDGVPKNEKRMIDMADDCRVNLDGKRVYATGWCAHGPRGVIVDAQQQALFVSEEIAADFEDFEKSSSTGVETLLKQRNVNFISWDDWKQIDKQEKEIGEKSGKCREKFTTFERFLKKL